jgi:hypothetical protein
VRIVGWKFRLSAAKFFRMMVARDGVEPPTPAPVARAQQEFDKRLADVLDGMANRMSGKTSDRHNGFRISVEDLEKTIQTYDSGKSQEPLTAQIGGFLSLSRKIASLTISLDNEMSVHGQTL